MKECPECHSDNIIKEALAMDRGDYNANVGFSVAVDENPDALMFKGRISSTVKAEICGVCGYIQFYAVNPQTLWAAYQNRIENN